MAGKAATAAPGVSVRRSFAPIRDDHSRGIGNTSIAQAIDGSADCRESTVGISSLL